MELEYRLTLPPFGPGVIDGLVALGAVVFGQIEAADVAWRLAHQPDASVFCAWHGADLVAFKAGYALTTRRYYSWLGGVHADHRRRGVAAELMNRQHRWLAERGYTVVETAANQENHAMATVNLRHGFSVCGVRSDPQRTQILFSKHLLRPRYRLAPEPQLMTEPSADPEKAMWHREVAMRCNNRAWSLSVQPRTAAEDRELLDAAHTSAYHWALVGTELNRMRATMLLAEVHALLGHGATALTLATDMHRYFLARTDTPDWELAFTHAVYAHCASAAGDVERHRAAYQDALVALAAVADEEDRDIVAQTFKQVPAP